MRKRYLAKSADSAFSMVKPSESEKTLAQLSKDLYQLVERFENHPAVSRMTSYQLMKRVLAEQRTITKAADGQPVEVEVKLSKEISSASLQNPSDPDAGYSEHKGQGYSTQVMETYREDKTATTLNLCTYAEVTGANVSDAEAVVPAVETVGERAMEPQTLLADSLCGGDENRQVLEQRGVDLVSPIMGQAEKSEIKLSDFVLLFFVVLGSVLSIIKEQFGKIPKCFGFPGHAAWGTAFALIPRRVTFYEAINFNVTIEARKVVGAAKNGATSMATNLS